MSIHIQGPAIRLQLLITFLRRWSKFFSKFKVVVGVEDPPFLILTEGVPGLDGALTYTDPTLHGWWASLS